MNGVRQVGRSGLTRIAFAVAMMLALGTHRTAAAQVQSDPNGPDPAAANMAPADAMQGDDQANYPPQPGTVQQGAPDAMQQPQDMSQQPVYADPNAQYADPNGQYATDVEAGQQAITSDQPPPPLPVYTQPPAPDVNYVWTPGYWAWGPGGYFWVPGAWVAAPYYGALWTPPYWGYYGSAYVYHPGYWGLHIGFYGGVNYGFGYFGRGYEGGYWQGNVFFYNRAVNNINIALVPNVYVHTVVVSNYSRVSFNGGVGGLAVRPMRSEMVAIHENHTPAMQSQVQHMQMAGANRQQFYNANHGRPAAAVAPAPLAAERGIRPPAPYAGRPAVQPQRVEPGARPGSGPYSGPTPVPAQRTGPGARSQPFEQPNRPQVQPQQPARPQQPQPQVRPQPQPQPQIHPQPQQQPHPQALPPARPAKPARPEKACKPNEKC